jgi:hypothetical protein
VLAVVTRALTGNVIHRAGQRRCDAETGVVTFIQRFGSALNLNIPTAHQRGEAHGVVPYIFIKLHRIHLISAATTSILTVRAGSRLQERRTALKDPHILRSVFKSLLNSTPT